MRQHLPPHRPVAHETEQRALERRRSVVFDKKVSRPGKSVAADDGREQPPWVGGENEKKQADQRQGRASEVQLAGERQPVLGQIQRIKLGKRARPGELRGVGG